MTRRQCIPARLDPYVNHDPRLIFKARLVFKAPASISTITSDPRPVFEARLVFKARLLFEEIRYRPTHWKISSIFNLCSLLFSGSHSAAQMESQSKFYTDCPSELSRLETRTVYEGCEDEKPNVFSRCSPSGCAMALSRPFPDDGGARAGDGLALEAPPLGATTAGWPGAPSWTSRNPSLDGSRGVLALVRTLSDRELVAER